MGTSALAAVLRGAVAVRLSEGRRRCGASVGSAGGERGEIVWLFVTLCLTNFIYVCAHVSARIMRAYARAQ
jgi:hypothetical protein